MPTSARKSGTDFTQYRLGEIRELEVFIKFDSDRYLAFNAALQDRLDSLRPGEVLYAEKFVVPRQYNIFVKLCCLRCFISRMPCNEDNEYYFDMLDDCSGCRKVLRKTVRRKYPADNVPEP